MRKDRNTFFQGSSMTESYMPNMVPNQVNYNMPGYPGPYQQTESHQSFYTGAAPTNFNNNSNYTDLENRISKLEREINRLNNRLSKSESNNNITTEYNTNMYMV